MLPHTTHNYRYTTAKGDPRRVRCRLVAPKAIHTGQSHGCCTTVAGHPNTVHSTELHALTCCRPSTHCSALTQQRPQVHPRHLRPTFLIAPHTRSPPGVCAFHVPGGVAVMLRSIPEPPSRGTVHDEHTRTKQRTSHSHTYDICLLHSCCTARAARAGDHPELRPGASFHV
jgi:hypothetical protein